MVSIKWSTSVFNINNQKCFLIQSWSAEETSLKNIFLSPNFWTALYIDYQIQIFIYQNSPSVCCSQSMPNFAIMTTWLQMILLIYTYLPN